MVLGHDNSLTIIRGDNDSLTITCTNKDGTAYTLVTGDTIYFSLKRTLEDKSFTIQKIITEFTPDGKATVGFTHSDTLSLKAPQYKYSVQLRKADGTVTTLAHGNFMVKEVVSYE